MFLSTLCRFLGWPEAAPCELELRVERLLRRGPYSLFLILPLQGAEPSTPGTVGPHSRTPDSVLLVWFSSALFEVV